MAIQVELIEPYSSAVGNKVKFLEILDKGPVERSKGGDWQVTEVSPDHLITAPIRKNGSTPPNPKKISVEKPTDIVIEVKTSRYSLRSAVVFCLVNL